MRLRRFIWMALLAAATLTTPAVARIGEKAADLRARFGKPESQPQKNVLVWLIEDAAGALVYTVTLDDKGVSIAEGLKPFRQAQLTKEAAQNFVGEQLSTLPSGHAAREVKAGEGYVFAGEKMTCGAQERVVVDDANGLLVIWTLAPAPNVLAVSRDFLPRTRR